MIQLSHTHSGVWQAVTDVKTQKRAKKRPTRPYSDTPPDDDISSLEGQPFIR